MEELPDDSEDDDDIFAQIEKADKAAEKAAAGSFRPDSSLS